SERRLKGEDLPLWPDVYAASKFRDPTPKQLFSERPLTHLPYLLVWRCLPRSLSKHFSTKRSGAAMIQRYDRLKAVQYARKWARGTNPQYGRMANDCTNFVSQVLYEGGW